MEEFFQQKSTISQSVLRLYQWPKALLSHCTVCCILYCSTFLCGSLKQPLTNISLYQLNVLSQTRLYKKITLYSCYTVPLTLPQYSTSHSYNKIQSSEHKFICIYFDSTTLHLCYPKQKVCDVKGSEGERTVLSWPVVQK